MSDGIDDETEKLLDDEDDFSGAPPPAHLFPVGSTWVVDNRGRRKGARLFTGRLTFWCCFSTGIEILYLPDQTVVQIERELPIDAGVVQVAVVSCPKQRELESSSGSIQMRWLRPVDQMKRSSTGVPPPSGYHHKPGQGLGSATGILAASAAHPTVPRHGSSSSKPRGNRNTRSDNFDDDDDDHGIPATPYDTIEKLKAELDEHDFEEEADALREEKGYAPSVAGSSSTRSNSRLRRDGRRSSTDSAAASSSSSVFSSRDNTLSPRAGSVLSPRSQQQQQQQDSSSSGLPANAAIPAILRSNNSSSTASTMSPPASGLTADALAKLETQSVSSSSSSSRSRNPNRRSSNRSETRGSSHNHGDDDDDDNRSVSSASSASSASSSGSVFSASNSASAQAKSRRSSSSQRRRGANTGSRSTHQSDPFDDDDRSVDDGADFDTRSRASSSRSEVYESAIETMEDIAKRSIEASRARLMAAQREALQDEKTLELPAEHVPPRMEACNAAANFPAGYLSIDQLLQAIQVIRHFQMSLPQVFQMLQDGKMRSITGDVYRTALRRLEAAALVESRILGAASSSSSSSSSSVSSSASPIPGIASQFWALLSVLPNDEISEIRFAIGEITISFEGASKGGDEEKGDGDKSKQRIKVKLPAMSSIVIQSGHPEDAMLACKDNALKVIHTDPRKFYCSREMKIFLSRTGIKGIRDGDLVQRGLINLDAQLRTEHLPKRIDADDKNRPFLWMLPSGKPAARNQHYCPRVGDDWLVFNSMRSEFWIMLPDLSLLYQRK